MLVKQTIFILCFLFFIVSIYILIHSINNKNKSESKYIIILSIIFIIYLFVNISIIPFVLDIDVGFELLLYYGISFVSGVLFIISIIVTAIKAKKLTAIDESKKFKTTFAFLILFPILMFCFSYFREMIYINNSKLILVCSEGEMFNKEEYAYAISNDYSKRITIGADFDGYKMKKYLPNSFHKLDYDWSNNHIEINEDNITIFKNGKVIYKINVSNKNIYCDVEEAFYKE